ncbi:MAG: manganese efflux pump [Firmicutes bacterium]|nr:manganese efflux pump [Bacillota bacterium]
MGIVSIFFVAALIALACSVDCFASAFAYGADRVRIPFFSALIINLVCCVVLGLGLLFGAFIGQYIDIEYTKWAGAFILVALGLSKIVSGLKKPVSIKADIDNNKVITKGEATLVSAGISLDGLAVGLSFGLVSLSGFEFFIIVGLAFVAGGIALYLGGRIGQNIANKTTLRIGWLGGVMLIALAIMNVVF